MAKRKNAPPHPARSLLARCGPEKARALTRDGPSDELWCAVRVATADDSEAVSLFRRLEEEDASDAADAATRGDEPRAAAMLRNAPVSDAAEARALAALLETTAAILDGYPTSDARDEALLRRAARARGEEAFSKTENEEGEEGEQDEEEDGQILADDVAEAVRCRLREKRLLIDALNTLQRAASLTLTGGVRLDVVAGDGAAAALNAVAASNAAKSPPGASRLGRRSTKRSCDEGVSVYWWGVRFRRRSFPVSSWKRSAKNVPYSAAVLTTSRRGPRARAARRIEWRFSVTEKSLGSNRSPEDSFSFIAFG